MGIKGLQREVIIVSGRITEREELLKESKRKVEVMESAIYSVEEALKADYAELDRLNVRLREQSFSRF